MGRACIDGTEQLKGVPRNGTPPAWMRPVLVPIVQFCSALVLLGASSAASAALTTLHHFTSGSGTHPDSELLASGGNFYGVASQGGPSKASTSDKNNSALGDHLIRPATRRLVANYEDRK